MDERLSEIFVEIAEMAHRIGIEKINKLDGCWEIHIDDNWFLAVNGHRKPKSCTKVDSPIEPFHAYVEWNGFPAGIISPFGGTIAAGELANEDTLIEALRQNGI